MDIFGRLWQWLLALWNLRILKMAYVDWDAPQPRTRDCTTYMLRSITNIGILKPKSHLARFYFLSVVINLMVTLYMPLGFFASFVLHLDNFSPSEFFTSLQISINCLGCSLKVVVFSFMYRHLLTSIPCMDELDDAIVEEDDKVKIREIVAFTNRSIFWYLSLFLCYASSTFLSAVYNGNPPYQLYNPFWEWSAGTANFLAQALIELTLIYTHCYQQAIMDSYPVVYITIIRTHLDILTRRIGKLGRDASLKGDQRYQALVECVLCHKTIMKIYNIFFPVISGTMFVQFLIIGLILGITTIHIMLFANWFAIISSLFYVMSILAETFPCSYLANCLMDDSDRLSLSIFHSAWPMEDRRYRKIIPYFMQHTQKTMVLTAMKIFPITTNSNINVMKFAFSVYTVIKQMNLGEKLLAVAEG